MRTLLHVAAWDGTTLLEALLERLRATSRGMWSIALQAADVVSCLGTRGGVDTCSASPPRSQSLLQE